MKYALIIEYDGSTFSGWQRQAHASTVQACVEHAVSKVANHEIGVACAGRTDAGVHAIAQVVHFETHVERSKRSWILGINANLPASIVIKNIIIVDEDFHARFSARARRYRYMIVNQPTRSALLAQRATWERVPLDESLMSAAAEYLVGEHDFTSFRALACQAHSPVREIYHLHISRMNNIVSIEVKANGFLHHMVRNLAGVLMSIGRGEHKVDWALEVLEARDRSLAGVTAPAQGLYFMAVDYDEKYAINEIGALTDDDTH